MAGAAAGSRIGWACVAAGQVGPSDQAEAGAVDASTS